MGLFRKALLKACPEIKELEAELLANEARLTLLEHKMKDMQEIEQEELTKISCQLDRLQAFVMTAHKDDVLIEPDHVDFTAAGGEKEVNILTNKEVEVK